MINTKTDILSNIDSIRKLNNIPTLNEYKQDEEIRQKELEKIQLEQQKQQLEKKQQQQKLNNNNSSLSNNNSLERNGTSPKNNNNNNLNGIAILPSVSSHSSVNSDDYTDDDNYISGTESGTESNNSSLVSSPRETVSALNGIAGGVSRVSSKYERKIKKNTINASQSNRLNANYHKSRKTIEDRKNKRKKSKNNKEETRLLIAKKLIRINSGPMSILNLVWGRFTNDTIKLRPNIIISADIFYNENDFEDILANVQYYFSHGCNSFYSVVQKRGTSRTLGTLLLKWKMKVEEIDILHTVMGSDYLSLEESEKMILVKITSAKSTKKSTHHRTQSVMGLLRMQTYNPNDPYNSTNSNNNRVNISNNNNSGLSPSDALYANEKNIQLDGYCNTFYFFFFFLFFSIFCFFFLFCCVINNRKTLHTVFFFCFCLNFLSI